MGVADERNRSEPDQHVNRNVDGQQVTVTAEGDDMRADRRAVAHQPERQPVALRHRQTSQRAAPADHGQASQQGTPGNHSHACTPGSLGPNATV